MGELTREKALDLAMGQVSRRIIQIRSMRDYPEVEEVQSEARLLKVEELLKDCVPITKFELEHLQRCEKAGGHLGKCDHCGTQIDQLGEFIYCEKCHVKNTKGWWNAAYRKALEAAARAVETGEITITVTAADNIKDSAEAQIAIHNECRIQLAALVRAIMPEER